MIFLTKTKLEKFLLRNKLPINEWGKGSAKTIDHLFKEIIKGESKIEIIDNELVRHVKALSITVLYKNLILKEDYQKFKDGRVRRRKMDASVAEKLDKNDKDLVGAVIRGIKEELDITINNSQISENGKNRQIMDSMSYPGLHSIVDLFKYTVILNDTQYKSDGYVENQEDKSTYFKWIENSINEEYKPTLSNFTSEEVQEIKDIFLDAVDEFSMQPTDEDGQFLVGKADIQYTIGCYRNAFIEVKTITDDIITISKYIEKEIIPRIKSLGYKILHYQVSYCNDDLKQRQLGNLDYEIQSDDLVITITK